MSSDKFARHCKKGCDGTGIYKMLNGFTDLGVVCKFCDGTGKDKPRLPFPPGVEKKHRSDIANVIPFCPYSFPEGIVQHDSIPYEEWFAGRPFKQMRFSHCPMLWGQSSGEDLGVRKGISSTWKYCCSNTDTITRCHMFQDRHICWEYYDKLKQLEELNRIASKRLSLIDLLLPGFIRRLIRR